MPLQPVFPSLVGIQFIDAAEAKRAKRRKGPSRGSPASSSAAEGVEGQDDVPPEVVEAEQQSKLISFKAGGMSEHLIKVRPSQGNAGFQFCFHLAGQ